MPMDFQLCLPGSWRRLCDSSRTGKARMLIPKEKRKCGYSGLRNRSICDSALATVSSPFFRMPSPTAAATNSGTATSWKLSFSPNGFWIDLDIGPGEKHDLKSGLQRRVILNEAAKTWVAEMALPMKCLVMRFDPAATWRVNFYRVEGAAEPRFYSAWQPTGTPAPNFHVPETFGELVFAPSPLPRK